VLKITTAELAHWDHVSRNLFVPFHGDGIISQFEDYETLKELDWRKYRKKYSNLQRLDRILEAEGDDPNRYKVSKQADVLMLFFLFSTEELKEIFDQLGYHFSPEMIGKNIQYYMARTSHGSTLSWVVHAWILSRWDRKGSWQLFKQAFNSDIGDLQVGTTAEGIHLGAMSGSIDLVQRCYPGIDIRANMLSFNPLLPAELECLRTTIHYRWHTLDVTVTHQNLTVSSRRCTASPITIAYRGHVRAISPGQTYEFRLIRPPEKPPITGPGQRDVLAAVTEQALDTLPDQEPIG
jgi:alpha,alpha-trehalase